MIETEFVRRTGEDIRPLIPILGQIWRNYAFLGSTTNTAMLLCQEPGVPVDFAITFVKLELAAGACM